jgi:hypothetical protein
MESFCQRDYPVGGEVVCDPISYRPPQVVTFVLVEAQTKPKVRPHGVTDDLYGKTVVLVAHGRRSGAHATTVSQKRGAKQVVTAVGLATGGAHVEHYLFSNLVWS